MYSSLCTFVTLNLLTFSFQVVWLSAILQCRGVCHISRDEETYQRRTLHLPFPRLGQGIYRCQRPHTEPTEDRPTRAAYHWRGFKTPMDCCKCKIIICRLYLGIYTYVHTFKLHIWYVHRATWRYLKRHCSLFKFCNKKKRPGVM